MIAAPDHDLPALTRAGNADALGDTRLFSLMGELKESEKRRDELLDRLSVDGALRSNVQQKRLAIRLGRSMSGSLQSSRRTAAGVLRQLELAARGWVAPATVTIAMAALREIADRPPPFKIGRLPPVPPATGIANRADIGQATPTSL